MPIARLFFGLPLVVLAVSLAAPARADQTPPATVPAALKPAASAPAGASPEAVTLARLQAENRALKAQVAELKPLTMWEKMTQILTFQPAGLWILVGFFGQFVFMMRFVVQWIASERKKRSVVPVAFWYLSLAGSLITIVYSVYRKDPVFTAAFCLNILIYLRNLYFIHRKPDPETAG